jgi:hypothetical protein
MEGRLKPGEMTTADQVKITDGLVIAAHEQVLPVVHRVAGDVIAPRCGAASEMLTAVVEMDHAPGGRKKDRG